MPYNSVADSFHTKKLVADFLQAKCDFSVGYLVLIDLFFARCYGWGATREYRFKIGDFAPTGTADPKFQVEGVAPPNILFLRKLV